MSRNSYHTDFKLAVFLNIATSDMTATIPKSTLHSFRHYDFSRLVGADFSHYPAGTIDTIKTVAQNKTLLSINIVLAKVYHTLKTVKHISLHYKSKLKDIKIKEKIINCVLRVKKYIPLKRAVRFFKISTHTFYNWLSEVRHKCLISPIQKCVRVWPNQLTKHEVSVMKKLCLDEEFRHWPVASIAYYALRSGILSASLSTWYKYVNILGIIRSKTESRRKKRRIGIRADRPNQLWHMDVTVMKLADNTKAYIYFVMDNYSRFILNFKVSLKLSGKICMENLREAFDKHGYNQDIQLMTDGGPENVNHTMEEYTESVPIRQIIAQVDIVFSNSMIEALNKIVKYNWLYRFHLPHFKALKKYMDFIVDDYNNHRPHISLKGLTPSESFHNTVLNKEQFSDQMKLAHRHRIEVHRLNKCPVCKED